MIRVLFVITRMAVGGVPQHVLTVIQKMDRSRYHITLATGLPGPEEGSLMAEACALGVEMYVLPDLKREVHLVHDVRAFYELYRIVRSGRYDIVHTHLSKAGILGRMAAWCAGVNRIVHTCHGDVFERYFGRLKSAMLLGVERLVGRATGRFVSVSRALKKQFQMYRIGRPNLFTVVHNGIDTRPFEGVRRRVGEGMRVGTLTMFYPVKRLDLFVEMARKIRKTRGDVVFEIAGGGRGEVELQASARDLGDGLRFLGVRSDASEVLAGFDLFVLCSDYEGIPTTLMEAMLSGLPVVATRVGGVPEVVVDGETGLLVPPGDADALADAVLHLMDDAALRKKMGEAGRVRALKFFSADRMVEQLDAVYRDLLGPKAKR